ncbi:MAG: hypothetical protein NC489_30985, partial [Ruminococcus flavefaciens]|nr:hypothetical protein [Ruminococcus flavefaciens]
QKDKLGEQEQIIGEMQEEYKRKADEVQEEYRKKMDEIQKERTRAIDETWRHGIRNAAALLKNLKMPEQEIKTRICEQFQISENQVQEFLA